MTATPGLLTLGEDVLGLPARVPPSARRDALLELSGALAHPVVRAAYHPLHWGDMWAAPGVAGHLQHRLADQVRPLGLPARGVNSSK